MWDEKKLLLGGTFAMILVTVAKLLDPIIMGHIIDKSVPQKDIKDVMIYAGFFVIVIITSGVMAYFQNILLAKMGVKIITKVKSQIFDHLLKLPVSYFDKYPVGELIARVESDSEKVKQLFSSFSIMLFGNALYFLGMFFVLLYKNAHVTFYLLMPIPVIVLLAILLMRYLNKFYVKIRQLYANLSAVLTEYIQGVSVIQLFNREAKVKKLIEEKSVDKKTVEAKAYFVEYVGWGFVTFLSQTLFIVLVILLIAPKVITSAMTLGTLVIFVQFSQRIFEPLIMIAENINFLQRAYVSLQRIFTILEMKTEKDVRDDKGLLPSFQEKIEFKNIWFQYKENEWVLRDVSFDVKKGEKIALVGASEAENLRQLACCVDFIILIRAIF